jgi:hypothetical protein
MKRLWIAVFLLVIILAGTLWNISYLGRFTGELADVLTAAQAKAEADDWAGAASLTDEAFSLWESREPYLHITLFHSDTDEIYVGFREVMEYIGNREDGDYAAANAKLIAKLSLLYKMDQLNLENVL